MEMYMLLFKFYTYNALMI